jgi:hypothetical protein
MACGPRLAVAAALLLSAACFPDWDGLDPSLGAGGSATGAAASCSPGETTTCYEGPSGTEGVGECAAGEATCDADGAGFGPCEGATLPAPETCDNGVDEDCDGQADELDAGCDCTAGLLYSCYDGPAGTEGTSVCAAGQRLCLDGGVLDACVGQTLPTHEDCISAADDDCDGAANEDCALWGLRFGDNGMNDDQVRGIAVLPSGDFVIAGHSTGVLNFGATNLPVIGGIDIVVAKLDAAGNEIWARRDGAAGEDEAHAVALDAAGNVIVVGSFAGTLDFGGNASPLSAQGIEDGFVAKFDPDGVAEWAVAFGGAGADATLFAVDVDDATGNVVAVGDFSGDIGLGASSEIDGFAVVLDAAGSVTASKAFGGTGTDRGLAVTWIGGDIAISGSFDETISFGGATTSDAGSIDGFVALVDDNLDQQWIERVGDAGYQSVTDLATDGSLIFAYGEGAGTINLGGNQGAAIDDDVFAFALDTGGMLQWDQQWHGPGDQHAHGLVADAAGGLWLGVSHELVVDYGGGPLTSAGDDDLAMVKLNAADGSFLKSVRLGGSGDEDPAFLGVDGGNELIIAAECRGSVDFGFGTLSGQGGYEDICLVKLPE